jgi:transcriptional regulator with XRE-family HTH domain
LDRIGEIIRAKREQKGLLLRHLAAQLDIDNAILSKIERGERKPTKELIVKLAEILEINQDELMIQFLSDKIAYEIVDENIAHKTLKLAEKKIQYLKLSKNGKV